MNHIESILKKIFKQVHHIVFLLLYNVTTYITTEIYLPYIAVMSKCIVYAFAFDLKISISDTKCIVDMTDDILTFSDIFTCCTYVVFDGKQINYHERYGAYTLHNDTLVYSLLESLCL